MDGQFYCIIWNYWKSIGQEDMRHEWQNRVRRESGDNVEKQIILLKEYHEKYPEAVDITWELAGILYAKMQFSDALKIIVPVVGAYPDESVFQHLYYLTLSEIFLTLSENTKDEEDKQEFNLRHLGYDRLAEEAYNKKV